MGRKPYKWATLPPRMRKRTRSSGTYFYYDMGGVPRQEKPLGKDFIAALQKWAELEKETSKSYRLTFIDAVEKYLKDVLPKKAKRTQADNIKELGKLREFFGNPPAPLDQIKPIHVRQYMQWRTKDGQGFTRANREKALFSHIFNMAREWGMTEKPNPCAGVKGFSEQDRSVYVEDDLFDRVFQAASVPVQEAMMLAYLTGQRPADTLKMNLSDIRDGCLHLTQNKTGQKIAIEVTGELKVWLDRISERRRDLKIVSTQLIVNENGRALSQRALSERFRKIRKDLGVELTDFQFRDLRAKAGTDKASSEGIEQAKAQLGHRNLRTTEIYVRKRKTDKVKPTK